MDNLTDLKAIWQTAKTDSLPSAAETRALVKKFRRERLRKKWLVIAASSAMVLIMLVMMFSERSKMITTHIGGILIMAAGTVLAVTNIRSLRRFYELNDVSNLDFLAFIEQTRLNQLYFYRKTQLVIFILTSVGLLFSLYEPFSRHPLKSAVLFITCTIWLLFTFLVLRPRAYKRSAAALNAMKERLEKISKQLSDDDLTF